MSAAPAPGEYAVLEAGSLAAPSPAYPGSDAGAVGHAVGEAPDVWETRDAGRLRARYAHDCVVHTPCGPLRGHEAVVQAAVDALAACADETVIVEEMGRREPAPGSVNTSHRVTRCVGGTAVAVTLIDRRMKDGLVAEEWRVRDGAGEAIRSGVDPFALAQAQAAADARGDQARHAWRSAWIAAVREEPIVAPPADHPAAIPAQALRLALTQDLFDRAAQACAATVETRWPTDRTGWGRDYWSGCLLQLRSLLHDVRLRLDGWAARPLTTGEVAVTLRWSLAGVHAGGAAWGEPSGRDVLIMAISHYRLRGAAILEDRTLFDEMAVLRQVAGGLGAAHTPSADPAAVAKESPRGTRT